MQNHSIIAALASNESAGKLGEACVYPPPIKAMPLGRDYIIILRLKKVSDRHRRQCNIGNPPHANHQVEHVSKVEFLGYGGRGDRYRTLDSSACFWRAITFIN